MQAEARTEGCSLQMDSRCPLWMATSKQFIECRGQTQVDLEPSCLCSRIIGAGRYLTGYQKRNLDTKPVTKPLIYNLSTLQTMLWQQGGKTCRSTLSQHKAHSKCESPCQTLPGWPGSSPDRQIKSPETQSKNKLNWSLKKNKEKGFLLMFCYAILIDQCPVQ